MKIVVLNGSPKGEYSNTIHCVKYIMKHRPDHEYRILEIGKDIKSIEKEPSRLEAMVSDMRSADGILWSFPVYYLSVPSQLMRFIELISGTADLREKYATAITTSVHFYDHLAHDYVRGVSEDMGMRYMDGFSGGMEDLLKPELRRQMLCFFDKFIDMAGHGTPLVRKFAPMLDGINEYVPGELKPPVAIGDKKIVLITDAVKEDVNLNRMVDVFRRSVEGRVDVVNISEIRIGGGCLGCIRCGDMNVCVYKDDLRSVYYERLKGADAVVFAGTIKGRWLSTRWKTYFDRSFVNSHCPLVVGKQYGYIVSGPLRQLPGLREDFEARAQVGGNNLAGIVTDEYEGTRITALVQQLAVEIARGMEVDYHTPPTYLGVGGHLIFRDLAYRMGWLFRADDRYYREHGLYDYPQKEYRNRLQSRTMKILMSFGPIRDQIYARAKEEPVKMYQKVIDEN
jgi:multimeric flavodoxin WrbA